MSWQGETFRLTGTITAAIYLWQMLCHSFVSPGSRTTYAASERCLRSLPRQLCERE
eukprot:COSAG02_NODE_54698_length_294_cov_1.610256_1_plen_55_part_01